MSETLARVCSNCNSFLPVPFGTKEKGICLADSLFEQYLDELLDHGNFECCRKLVEEQQFSEEHEVCARYDEVDIIECSTEEMNEIIGRRAKQNVHPEAVKRSEFSFQEHSFVWLLEHDKMIREFRQEFQKRSRKERLMTADNEYHAAVADQIFQEATGQSFRFADIPGEVIALAIDPEFAPALLTVGTYEYIFGRFDECMRLLLSLIDVSWDREDLIEIIDKAGQFLFDGEDYARALELYSAARKRFTDAQPILDGIEQCTEKLQQESQE